MIWSQLDEILAIGYKLGCWYRTIAILNAVIQHDINRSHDIQNSASSVQVRCAGHIPSGRDVHPRSSNVCTNTTLCTEQWEQTFTGTRSMTLTSNRSESETDACVPEIILVALLIGVIS
jgi:hypothetical protein